MSYIYIYNLNKNYLHISTNFLFNLGGKDSGRSKPVFTNLRRWKNSKSCKINFEEHWKTLKINMTTPLEWSYTRHWSIACMQKLGNHTLWFLWGVKNHDTTIWCMQESKSTCRERERFRATSLESPLYLLMLRWEILFIPLLEEFKQKFTLELNHQYNANCPEVGFREIIIKFSHQKLHPSKPRQKQRSDHLSSFELEFAKRNSWEIIIVILIFSNLASD